MMMIVTGPPGSNLELEYSWVYRGGGGGGSTPVARMLGIRQLLRHSASLPRLISAINLLPSEVGGVDDEFVGLVVD